MKKTKLMTLCGVLAIGASLLGSTQVYAYENGQNDPHAATNTLEVKKTDSATISAEGTFETFDPTQPVDPSKPTPDKTHKAWVDVKIPPKFCLVKPTSVKVLFHRIMKSRIYQPKASKFPLMILLMGMMLIN